MQLELSLGKCSILHLGKRTGNDAREPKYQLGQVQLNKSDSMKDLGVIIDPQLKFSTHISAIVKKAFMRMNCIFRSFETRDTEFLLQMYKTYVRPTIEYASECWSPGLVKDIKLLESVQKAFTRRIPSIASSARQNIPNFDKLPKRERLQLLYIERLSYPKRLKKLNLERLDLRRLHCDLVFAYKLMYGHLDVDPNLILSFHPQAYDNYEGLRIADTFLRLQKPSFKVQCRQNYFGVRIVSPWNELPLEVKQAKSVKHFKSYLNGSIADRRVDLSTFLTNIS